MNRNERVEWSISRCYQYRASHANPAAIGPDHRDRNAATFAAYGWRHDRDPGHVPRLRRREDRRRRPRRAWRPRVREADLPPGEVEIRVGWSSVNYKDGLATRATARSRGSAR